MKIRINKDGCLEIMRKNTFKEAECPFAIDYTQEMVSDGSYEPYLKEYSREYRYCGDRCSQFSEPDYHSDFIELDTCHVLYEIEKKDFEDLREE